MKGFDKFIFRITTFEFAIIGVVTFIKMMIEFIF